MARFEDDLLSVKTMTKQPYDGLKENATGVMVAFFLQRDVAQKLVLPDGERAEDLHMTLVLLPERGKYGEPLRDPFVSPRILRGTLGVFASLHAPLSAMVSGIGCFRSKEGKSVFYASVDVPGLEPFRHDLLETLSGIGYEQASEHGFTPHITLQYLEPYTLLPTQWLPPLPLLFDTLSLAVGMDRYHFRLLGN